MQSVSSNIKEPKKKGECRIITGRIIKCLLMMRIWKRLKVWLDTWNDVYTQDPVNRVTDTGIFRVH